VTQEEVLKDLLSLLKGRHRSKEGDTRQEEERRGGKNHAHEGKKTGKGGTQRKEVYSHTGKLDGLGSLSLRGMRSPGGTWKQGGGEKFLFAKRILFGERFFRKKCSEGKERTENLRNKSLNSGGNIFPGKRSIWGNGEAAEEKDRIGKTKEEVQ